jgi:hypothetical protein
MVASMEELGHYSRNIAEKWKNGKLGLQNLNTLTKSESFRTFYFSPSKDPKITCDTFHLLMSFELGREIRDQKTAYVPFDWKILTLDCLTVDLKHEFNQSNVKMYGNKSEPKAILAEGPIE